MVKRVKIAALSNFHISALSNLRIVEFSHFHIPHIVALTNEHYVSFHKSFFTKPVGEADLPEVDAEL